MLDPPQLVSGLSPGVVRKRANIIEGRPKPGKRFLDHGRLYTYLYVAARWLTLFAAGAHKTLKSVVRSLAESFTSLMNYGGDDYVMGHIVHASWRTGGREFRVDLLTGVTDSSPLLVPEVLNSVASYVEWLPDLVRRSKSDLDFIAEAELVVSVDPSIRRPHRNSGFFESPFTCAVRIVDDRGKEYSHQISDWWYPEKVLPVKRWWQLW